MSDTLNNETYINDIVSKITDDSLSKSRSDLKCAPGLKYESGSCARLYVLVELAKAYNLSAQPQDQIRLLPSFELINPQKYKKYLVYELTRRVGDKCTTQKCWTKQEFIKHMSEKAREEFEKYTFRPNSPAGQFDWLSTFDINDTMAQYERIYKDFKFFGAVPMDFAELPQLEISNIDYDKYYKKGITQLGFTFNTQKSYQSGEHWISMYTNLSKGHIFYFDSFGIKPGPEVRKLIRQQVRYMQSIGKKIDDIRIDYNKKKHQTDSYNCGVHSIAFLVKMARGCDFDKLCSAPTEDKIQKCRSVYFDKHVHDK